MPSTVVSSPGKVLLAGGYLVLDPAYSGIVVSTSSRFYTVIDTAQLSDSNRIRVRSPQFVDAEWTYTAQVDAASDTPSVVVDQVVSGPGASRNKFVHLAIQRTLTLAVELQGAAPVQSALVKGLDITIVGDNDFYSQRAQLTKLNLPPTLASLSQISPFAPTGVTLSNVHKTGLGSSAALITSLVSALLLHLGAVPPTSLSSDAGTSAVTDGRRLAHNAAQYVHCLAQGKVGSGFDVASAVFGSQMYTRFDPTVLQPLMNDDAVPAALKPTLSPSNGAWDYRVEPFQLPPHTRLMLADVDAGSDTPSLVGKVLKWRQAKPDQANALWTALDKSNMAFAKALMTLSEMHKANEAAYVAAVRSASNSAASSWSASESQHVRAIHNAHSLGEDIRSKMREMGTLCDVPIEPQEQSRLLDACVAQPGVIAGGVPGAGGYDAIWLLVCAPEGGSGETAVDRVQRVWAGWKEMDVSPLSATESMAKGIRLEDVDAVPGLRAATSG